MSEKSIVSVAIAFSICFVSLLWFLNKNNSKIDTISNTINSVSPTATPEWKVYVDSKQNFSLNYPSNWNKDEKALLETGDYLYISSPNNSIFRVDIIEDNSKTIAEYLTKIEKQNLTAYEGKPSITVTSTKNTIIANLNCVQRQENYNAAGFSVYSTYFKKGNSIYILTLQPQEGTIHPDDIVAYQNTLSSFKFTESNVVNRFKLGTSNFFLELPSNFIVNKNNITLGTSIYNISTFVGPGLCPMDPDDDSCSYYEKKDTLWGTYKVWTKYSKPFAVNPISIEISKKYFEGLIITKSKPNEFFTQTELSEWKDILNKISYSE